MVGHVVANCLDLVHNYTNVEIGNAHVYKETLVKAHSFVRYSFDMPDLQYTDTPTNMYYLWRAWASRMHKTITWDEAKEVFGIRKVVE